MGVLTLAALKHMVVSALSIFDHLVLGALYFVLIFIFLMTGRVDHFMFHIGQFYFYLHEYILWDGLAFSY